MTQTTYIQGTVVQPAWLNDVDALTYNAAGLTPGSVARSGQSKFQEMISVKDFGAVGDGTTDDTAAIQAAFNYANNATLWPAALNPSVYLPKGTYLVGDLFFSPSTPGSENNAPASLIGSGIRSSVLLAKTGTTTVLHAKNTTLRSFKDFWINCNSHAVNGFDTSWDVSVGASINNNYENIRISGFSGTGWLALGNNDISTKNIQIPAPTGSQTSIDISATGGQVNLTDVKTEPGFIDIGAQTINLIGCVTQGVRLKYAGLNQLNVFGGYHYVNATNSIWLEIQSSFQCKGVEFTGYIDTKGAGDSFIGGVGTELGYVNVKAIVEGRAGASGSMRFLGAGVLNGTGSLRGQLEVELVSDIAIDWSVDMSKFHLVNYESKVLGFNPPDTTLALFNSWIAFGAGWGTLRSRNLPGSRIKLFGMIKSGTLTAATKIAQCAAGQSPTENKTFPAANTTAFLNVTLDTTGAITLANAAASATWIAIDATVELET